METRKQIEEILLNDYGCFDDFTVDKLLDLFGVMHRRETKADTDEFTEKCLWYFGCVDENGNKCYEENTFTEIERKYFEGYNLPRKIVNGKMESSDDSYNRMKRWYKLSYDERCVL